MRSIQLRVLRSSVGLLAALLVAATLTLPPPAQAQRGPQSVAGVVAVDAAQERDGDGVTEGQVRHELEREVQQ